MLARKRLADPTQMFEGIIENIISFQTYLTWQSPTNYIDYKLRKF